MSSMALIAVGLAIVAMFIVGAMFFLLVLGVGLCLLPVIAVITGAAERYHEWRWRRAELGQRGLRVRRAPASGRRHGRPHFGT